MITIANNEGSILITKEFDSSKFYHIERFSFSDVESDRDSQADASKDIYLYTLEELREDLLAISRADDFVWGYNFAETLYGSLGDDTIYGEQGDDTIYGLSLIHI